MNPSLDNILICDDGSFTIGSLVDIIVSNVELPATKNIEDFDSATPTVDNYMMTEIGKISISSLVDLVINATEPYVGSAEDSASDAQSSAESAATSATLAQAQVALAKAQVTLATTQAESASTSATSAQAQVTLATAQVTLATTQAQSAASSATSAQTNADYISSVATSIETNQSLKFDKINDGYVQFGDGITGRNWAKGSLVETLDCNNLTFCFQAVLSYGLLYLYGRDSTSNEDFGIGVSSYTSGISLSIGFYGTTRNCNFVLDHEPTLDEAFVLTVEDVDFENGTLTVKLYSSTFEGAMLPTSTTANGTFPVEFQLTGYSICSAGSSYPNVPPVPCKRSFKNLKAFNFVLPLNDDDDTNSIGYTIEDYLNGKDEPPSLRDATATNQALVSLLNYTCTVGTTKYITNIGTAGNAIEAIWAAGYMGGSKDDEINALADYIIARS